ncbi:unnamed protein product [Nippostrongylus brasiliensis]|uniref:A to I editase domain-containing protein n=1 Tax=Nippostrongylus brasiliensis TaxID=27835 RepID=A0A0N4Y6Z9_NIPBR|nr:unnamed protein product [Nippostrongylus brasiliensis]
MSSALVIDELPDDVREMITRTRKNPISLFSELYVQVFKFLFVISVNIGDVTVKGTPHRTKKVAKLDCFIKGIKVLCEKFALDVAKNAEDLDFRQESTFFELLRKHTYAKFYGLSSARPEIVGSEKVIASIFLVTRSANGSGAEMISLATGNKGLRGDMLSLQGHSVNDCHAEVIARRGLLRFLYAQVLLYLRDPSKSIFVKSGAQGKLALRKGLSFHMFINTAPCGDARVYSWNQEPLLKNETETNSLLRFKIENGMGTILGRTPETFGPQTVDGIAGGERLRTMSCSDKIMRWNVLGVQGELLSLIIDPIYLSSVAVAEKADKSRLERALFGRVEDFKPTAPFCVNKPYIGHCQTEPNPRDTLTGAPVSVNWNIADDSIEVWC